VRPFKSKTLKYIAPKSRVNLHVEKEEEETLCLQVVKYILGRGIFEQRGDEADGETKKKLPLFERV